jgi:hypothetical protein
MYVFSRPLLVRRVVACSLHCQHLLYRRLPFGSQNVLEDLWTARLNAKSFKNCVEVPCTEHQVQFWLVMKSKSHSEDISIAAMPMIVQRNASMKHFGVSSCGGKKMGEIRISSLK